MQKITREWLKKRIYNYIDEQALEEVEEDEATPEELLKIIDEYPSKSRWLKCLFKKADNEFVQLLIDAGADLDAQGSSFGRPALYDATRDRRIELFNLLLSAGADPNVQDYFGWTPLHIAASRDYPDLAVKLVDGGARLEIGSEKGNTPLNIAAACGSPETMEVLIDRGASIHTRGYMDLTPFLYSAYLQNFECLKVIVEAGAFTDVEDKTGRSWKSLCPSDKMVNKINKYLEEL